MDNTARKLGGRPRGRSGDPTSIGAEEAPLTIGPKETRLNLVYKGAAMKTLLDRLQDLGHHNTMTDVVSTALRYYEAMLLEREKGNQIVVRDNNGGIPLRLF